MIRAAAAASLLLCALGSARAASFEDIKLAPQELVLGFALADMDGDRRVDPVIAGARKTGADSRERFLNVYHPAPPREGAPFGYVLAKQLAVPDDVLAFGVADLLGKGRAQLIYFTARSVFALDPESGSPARVLEGERFFLALPAPDQLPSWDGFDDLDGDGRADLLLPVADGYRVYLQRQPGKLTPAGELAAGTTYRSEPPTRRLRRIRDQSTFATARSLNRLCLADVNADRRTDLIGMKEKDLLSFLQRPDGSYAREPSATFRLVGPRGIPFEELALDAQRPPPHIAFGDANKDGRSDFVVPEIDVRELVMRLRIFLTTDKGLPESPSQILKLSSLGDTPELIDINGDGFLDLGVGTVRTDRLLKLTQPTIQTIDFTYYAFLYHPDEGRFSARPDIAHDVSYTLPDEKDEKEQRRVESQSDDENDGDVGVSSQAAGFLRLEGDFDHDGVLDLSLLRETGQLSIYRIDAGRDHMSPSVADEPLLEAKVEPTNDAWIQDLDGDGRSDFVFRHRGSLELLVSR